MIILIIKVIRQKGLHLLLKTIIKLCLKIFRTSVFVIINLCYNRSNIIVKAGEVMNKDLTPKQASILSFIKKNIRQKGYPPSVREIGQAVGLSSSSTVHSYLKKLEGKGYLRRDATKPRAIEVIGGIEEGKVEFVNVPLLGRVAAGTPLLAVENREELFPLPAHFTGVGEFFMLSVRGDSMVDAGILNGDMVVVRQQNDADNGDVIVALLEDEATVKRFFREDGRIRLQPENIHMEPIYTMDLQILGKVIGLVRKFN